MNRAYRILFPIIAFAVIVFIEGCGDPVPFDYTESFLVDALLVVGDPIQNIKVMKSLPLTDSIAYEKSMVRNAEVVISGDGGEFKLKTDPSGVNGYYFEDANYKVKPNTEYSLKIILPGGKIVTGHTLTPGNLSWEKKSPKFLQFPVDTVNMPAKDTIGWTKVPNTLYYIISIRALDTIDYGKYFNTPTAELNRHVYRPHSNPKSFRELTFNTPVPNNKCPVVWGAFRWFGMHEVNIYAPTEDYLKWFLQSFGQQMDPNLSSVKGAFGVFGSAAIIRDTVFLLKNQP